MNQKERYFVVEYRHRAYTVIGNGGNTLDTVWASQKCFFLPGSVVKITDPEGNSKTFRKQEDRNDGIL